MANERQWNIEFVREAGEWLQSLEPRSRKRIDKSILGLTEHGPVLGRPRCDSIQGSRLHNMKELRSVGGHIRVLFAFEPRGNALMLVGGDKSGNWKRWYKDNIPLAEARYERHLRQRGDEPPWRTRDPRDGGPSRGPSR